LSFYLFLSDDDFNYIIESVKDDNNMAKVTLKNLRKNRKYFISHVNVMFNVNSSTYIINLHRCMRYTIKVKNCADKYLTIPPGRYRRVLLVSFFFFFDMQ